MRGASALQGVLDEFAGKPVRAFIVWEPVLPTDHGPPSRTAMSQLHDGRADQYWDSERLLSNRVLAAARRGVPQLAVFSGDQEAAWDLVAIYPPGMRWQGDLPTPVYVGNPVMSAIDSLRARLAAAR